MGHCGIMQLNFWTISFRIDHNRYLLINTYSFILITSKNDLASNIFILCSWIDCNTANSSQISILTYSIKKIYYFYSIRQLVPIPYELVQSFSHNIHCIIHICPHLFLVFSLCSSDHLAVYQGCFSQSLLQLYNIFCFFSRQLLLLELFIIPSHL
jgi:hypothetical protein